MTRNIKSIAMLAAGVLLAGCAGDVDFKAIDAVAKPDPGFQKALGDAYVDYARVETEEYDRADANMFAEKALRAYANEEVLPTEIADREIAPDAVGDLEKARSDLMSAFARAGRTLAAGETATAQAAFDCWLQEQEEGHQPDDIRACRETFETALAAAGEKLQATLVVLLEQDGGKVGAVTLSNAGREVVLDKAQGAVSMSEGKAPEDAGSLTDNEIGLLFGNALGAVPEAPLYYVLYFKSGSNELTEESAAKLPEVIETIVNRSAPDITVIGHSDRVGRAETNARLSLVRARSVGDMLLARGVSPDIMDVTSFGESDNAVPTADNVAEPANRRVEISVR
jgi:OOP family OmpA-OmpF porin